MSVLEAKGVTKRYGNFLALSDFSVNVEQGSVFALLGPNGAGKTTFVKSLLGLVSKTKGDINIFGQCSSSVGVKEKVAYLPEKFTFFPYYTVQSTLKFFASMRSVSKDDIDSQVSKALEMTKIDSLTNKKLSTLSKGQLQRVGIATLLIGDVDLFIVDEPFSGLDPIGIKDFKNIIVELKSLGKTIFINSHILSEMEILCDSLAIINKGKCLVSGNVEQVIGDSTLEDYFYKTVGDQ